MRSFVFGTGGHARVIASLVNGDVTFVSQGPTTDALPEDAFFAQVDQYRDASVYIGIGNNDVRRAIFDKLKRAGVRVATCVASNAFVARDAVLGEGATICAGAVVGAGARIGDNAIVNTLSSVDHDCIIGDDTQITAGVTIAGNVRVGMNCFFGVKSAVVPNIIIGSHTQVMAGALVVKDLGDHVVAGGNPARIIATA